MSDRQRRRPDDGDNQQEDHDDGAPMADRFPLPDPTTIAVEDIPAVLIVLAPDMAVAQVVAMG